MSKPLPPILHNLAALFEFCCHRKPQELAYAFVRDTLELESQLTYAELESRVRSLVGHLARRAQPGTRVLLLYPPGIDVVCAFWACTYAGLVPVPAPAPDPVRRKHSLPRLRAIIEDAQVSLVLTTSGIETVSSELSTGKDGRQVEWLITDRLSDQVGVTELPPLEHTALAYLQYTSGSTATPRGVMISHGNVLSHCKAMSLAGEVSDGSRSLCWLPYFHDYGLLHGIIAPFYAGIPAYLMSPITFLRRPLRWLEAVSRFSITHSGGPNFSYESCLRAARQQPEWQTNLSTWAVASCGAEPVHADTVERFVATFGPQGFRRTSFAPAYGLAEATLLVTMKQPEAEPTFFTIATEALADSIVKESPAAEHGTRTLVGCGVPLEETRVLIVNPATRRSSLTGEVGEVWVAGAGVATGYWGRPDESDATFKATLAGSGVGSYLRTGDLGFIHRGELFLTGRLKDLIIVRGRNYYPHDLEWTAEQAYPGLRQGCGAAFSIESETGERVVLVYEIEKKLPESDMSEVMSGIRRVVAEEYELEVHTVVLVKSGTIPRTSSGKIQRHACRADFEAGQLVVVGTSTLDATEEEQSGELLNDIPLTPLEQRLAAIWQEVLGGPPPRRHANFFALGGNSLLVAQLVARILDVFQVELSLSVVFECPTFSALATRVRELGTNSEKTETAVEGIGFSCGGGLLIPLVLLAHE
jgi:acyl-CoA synthetase (AMP-forming)/AMP-acid ligase II